MDFSRDFIAFACEQDVLRFGEFTTKAGRLSPYFFNAGSFADGASLAKLSDFYARAILASAIPVDMLFGLPAPLSRWHKPATTCLSVSTARKPRTTARAAP